MVKKYLFPILAVFVILISIIPAAQVLAVDEGITITPAVINNPNVYSGTSFDYTITVTNPFPISLEVAGLGVTPGGAPINVPAQEDTTPFTARPWITLDKNQLPTGTGQAIIATITVPSGIEAGEKYAAIYMSSQPGSGGNAAIISSVMIPIILTVDSASFTPDIEGQIINLGVADAYSGSDLKVSTTFSNTGNCRITGAKNKVTITNSSGAIQWQKEMQISSPSVLPNYPRIITITNDQELTPGNYTATSEIKLNDGTQLDIATYDFTVAEGLPDPPALTTPGNNDAPGPIVNTLTPTFQWQTVTGASKYSLSLFSYPYEADDLIYNPEQLTGTSYTLPSGILATGSKYCWHMKTFTNNYWSESSETLYFQTYTMTSITTSTPAVTITLPLPTSTTPYSPLPTLTTPVLSPAPPHSTTPLSESTGANPPAATTPTTKPVSSAVYLLPGEDESSLVIGNFTDQDTPYIDAIEKAGVFITLSEPGNGFISVGKYNEIPPLDVDFSASVNAGGAGGWAIKYIGISSDGFTRGTATIYIYYTDDEIGDIDPNTLFISYFYQGKWRKCSNIQHSIENRRISGEIPVSRIKGTVIGLGGELLNQETVPLYQAGTASKTNAGISWSLAGIIIASTVICGSVVLLVVMNRRKNSVS